MNKTVTWSIGAAIVIIIFGSGLFAVHAQMMSGDADSTAADGGAAQGKLIADTQCAACHGADGSSPTPLIPKLAGQRAVYLFAQLQAFKDHSRRSEAMRGIAVKLSSTDMANIAAYYAAQTVQPDAAADSSLTAAGERIFLNGTANGATPCAMCHGSGGSRGMHGMMGGGMMMGGTTVVPRLDGQHADYLVDQLNRYASGQRQNPTMSQIAGALTDAERKEVAAYISGLH